jgi:hypothetical protein
MLVGHIHKRLAAQRAYVIVVRHHNRCVGYIAPVDVVIVTRLWAHTTVLPLHFIGHDEKS